jgi:uncharacterized membrane protein (UPF0127 family)
LLVKAHSNKYLEDFGLKKGQRVYLYYQCLYGDDMGTNKGPVIASSIPTSVVVRVNAMWVDRDLKIRCQVADTELKKRQGLQGFAKLEEGTGLYFPYSPYGEEVTFHQGSVSFGLDLIFLKDDKISKIEPNTKVGSSERWTCPDCSGVIEVSAGFCEKNKVRIGERIALFAVSKKDLVLLENEKLEAKTITEESDSGNENNFYYKPNSVNLVSQVVDSL